MCVCVLYVARRLKGSVFVEFGSVGDAKKFLTSEKIQFNGTDLLVEWKADYFKRKEEERKQKKEEQRKASSGKEGGEEEKDGSKEERKSVVRVSGCILHFSGVGSGKPRDDLKNELLPFGTVAFVDFPHGKTEGYVRFREEDGAKRAREGLLGKAVGDAGVAQLCGCDVELRVLEGMSEIHTQLWTLWPHI
jgi:lupus La protein